MVEIKKIVSEKQYTVEGTNNKSINTKDKNIIGGWSGWRREKVTNDG